MLLYAVLYKKHSYTLVLSNQQTVTSKTHISILHVLLFLPYDPCPTQLTVHSISVYEPLFYTNQNFQISPFNNLYYSMFILCCYISSICAITLNCTLFWHYDRLIQCRESRLVTTLLSCIFPTNKRTEWSWLWWIFLIEPFIFKPFIIRTVWCNFFKIFAYFFIFNVHNTR